MSALFALALFSAFILGCAILVAFLVDKALDDYAEEQGNELEPMDE